ncbi:anti-sigma factor domain-containing protein [Virgibacillus necropolis]|uniref:RsgI N-terminal anti-sigma domain-containing protein n=1 Tax=Virgibacillus necropolis TaxID=163877 RepID=A0A221MG52_9BACI|nr:anti-sigma factor domain-containing protein [Virgibacillus necropolis]ASN06625.1 hypothetical protein CFK40_17165 [Virgibacillus necropolis]
MSKGIVMEKHRKFTIVMTKNGSFHKVKPVKEADIGAEVSYEILPLKKSKLLFFQPKNSGSMPVKYIAIACMVLLFIMPFYLLGGPTKTYAYVNLDINPSLEIEIDDDLNVVYISPLNDDARKLKKQLPDYEGKKIEQVIEIIMKKSDALGLTKNGKTVLVGVSYVNDQAISVLDTVDNYFSTHQTSWDMATFQVSKEIRKRALKKDISMNKIVADTMEEEVSNPERMIIQPRVSDGEKELIHSFYTNSKSNHPDNGEEKTIPADQKPNPPVVPKPEKKKTDQHPSELKEKNSGIHLNKKNEHNHSDKVKKNDNNEIKKKDEQEKRHRQEKQGHQEEKQVKEKAKQEEKEAKRVMKPEKNKAKKAKKEMKKTRQEEKHPKKNDKK